MLETSFGRKVNKMKYSGKVTGDHPIGMDMSKYPSIKQVTMFDVQWSDCPVEVEDEVRKLWQENELNNDICIFKWKTEDHKEEYPVIAEYLTSKGVSECLIHWWW